MKVIVFTTLFLFINSIANGQNDCVILKKIIDEHVLRYKQPGISYTSTTLLILEYPKYTISICPNDFYRYKKQYKKLDEKTFADFLNQNQERTINWDCKYTDIEIIRVSQEISNNWNALIEKYPNWNLSILEFSNIGFNEEKNQALMYYGFYNGPLSAGGFFIVFEKKRDKWKEKFVIPIWST